MNEPPYGTKKKVACAKNEVSDHPLIITQTCLCNMQQYLKAALMIVLDKKNDNNTSIGGTRLVVHA